MHWQSTKGNLSNSSKYQISSFPGSKEHVLQVRSAARPLTQVYASLPAPLKVSLAASKPQSSRRCSQLEVSLLSSILWLQVS